MIASFAIAVDRKLEVIKSSSSSFDCLFCADPISPSAQFVHSVESSSGSISSRILSNFHRPLSLPHIPLPLALCECSFRRRLLEFMDMAFNPTNWWTIVCSSGTGGSSSSPPSEWRDATAEVQNAR